MSVEAAVWASAGIARANESANVAMGRILIAIVSFRPRTEVVCLASDAADGVEDLNYLSRGRAAKPCASRLRRAPIFRVGVQPFDGSREQRQFGAVGLLPVYCYGCLRPLHREI